MIKNYVATALRHLLTQKLYTAINVLGLAIGLACFIVIALFVHNELSYDRHYAKADRIYRISRDFLPTERSSEARLATIAPRAAPLLEQDFPQIEQSARLSCCSRPVLGTSDGELFDEPGFREADNELFEIFDFEWLRGDPKTALARPYTVVLTRSAAHKYFGDRDPIGRTLLLENRWPLEVTGVIEDLPDETHLEFSMLGSLLTTAAIRGEQALNNWGLNQYYTYILLKEGADVAAIQSEAGDFFERHFEQGSSAYTRLVVTALTDVHLRSNQAEIRMKAPGSAALVYTFSAIAVFILLIACINFMNLSTARSAQRAKEIGVRKAIGAGRGQVITQFLSESVLLAFLATVLAVTFVELALPWFNAFMELELTFHYLDDPRIAAALAVLALTTGLAAGSYPAFYLSIFEPARVLKGDMTRGTGAATFRKLLVVLQFSISIGLLIATAIVYQQMRFARSVELGYNKDQVVILDGSPRRGLGEQWETLKREWLAHPEITHVTASMLTPATENVNAVGIRAEGRDPEGGGMPFLWVDYGFFETYGIELVTGRTFSEEFGDRLRAPREGENEGEAAYILNESAARRLGWKPDEAIGKWLELTPAQGMRGPVIGVVRDVRLESVHNAIKPMVYMVPPEGEELGYVPLQSASVRITGRNVGETLDYIDRKWTELVPDQPVSRRFLDQDFDALYRSEERQAQMFTSFSALAIFIACLGLFGLASFATERRTKEIGIRKVMGGSVWDVVRMFTSEFGRLVLLANLIAWPVAYFLMQRWLTSFAYRIDIGLLVFVASALVALVIAWLTVGAVAARAATARPVEALRYE